MPSLFDVVKTASKVTNKVLVGFSGGKDSVVTLDLCCKYFNHVEAFFMYLVNGLSFQNEIIDWARRKYRIKIHKLPHFDLSKMLRYGSYRFFDESVPEVKITDIYEHLRQETGIHWIAAGERIADSLTRRALIKHSGSIDEKRGRIYPVSYWNKAQILSYIDLNGLKISHESGVFGYSFRDIMPKTVYKVKQHYPADYEKIKQTFPLIEAAVIHYERQQVKQVSEV